MLSLARHLPTLHLICIGAASASGDLFSARRTRSTSDIPGRTSAAIFCGFRGHTGRQWRWAGLGLAQSQPWVACRSPQKAKPLHVVVPGGETVRPGESPIAPEGSLEPDGNGL